MKDHFDLTDDEFFDQMETGILRKKYFSHSAHLRLAWIHIEKFGPKAAEDTIATQIKNYVTRIGMGDKFNLSLTIACVRILQHYIDLSRAKSFMDLINRYPELQNDFRSVLAQYYSDIVFSEAAKHKFIEPDRQPF